MRRNDLPWISTHFLWGLLLRGFLWFRSIVFAGGPARIPGQITFSLTLSHRSPTPTADGILFIPIGIFSVTSPVIELVGPILPFVATAPVAVPAAAATAPAPLSAFAPPDRFFHRLLWCSRRFASGVPDSRVDGLAQFAPEPHLRKGLHDLWPAAADAIVEALCLSHRSPVEEAQELRAETFRRTIIGGPDRHTCIEIQQVRLLKPLRHQRLHVTAVEHPRGTLKLDLGPGLCHVRHFSLCHDTANSAKKSTGFGKQRLLWSLQHHLSGCTTHNAHNELQRISLFLKSLSEFFGSL
mmetsp:Transcript_44620/g.73347  ORF Transcript_44620/g.73347 Transcript_44620/m.73347 type:complete len:296 (+) Transcript_44620:213-1100(+)